MNAVLNAFVVLGFILFANGNPVFVSNDGKDAGDCGSTINDSCRTIKYVLQIITKDVDTIILNGGHSDKRMKYYVNSTLQLKQNIKITMFNGSRFKPTITSASTTTFAFSVISSTRINVQFHWIDFVDVNILSCHRTTAVSTIGFHHCDIISNRTRQRTFYQPAARSFGFVQYSTLVINHCNVRQSDVHSTVRISVSVTNSVISDATLAFHKLQDLKINNAIFHDFDVDNVLLVVTTYGGGRFERSQIYIHIISSHFYNIKADKLLKIESKTLDTTNLVIRNATFENCTVTTLLSLTGVKSFLFMNSVVQNNRVIYGGTLHSTNASISNVQFLRNSLAGTRFIIRAKSIFVHLNPFFLLLDNALLVLDTVEVTDNTINTLILSINCKVALINSLYAGNNISKVMLILYFTSIKVENVTIKRNSYSSNMHLADSSANLRNFIIEQNTKNTGCTGSSSELYVFSMGYDYNNRMKAITIKNVTIKSSCNYIVFFDNAAQKVRYTVSDFYILPTASVREPFRFHDNRFKVIKSNYFHVVISCFQGSNPQFSKEEKISSKVYILRCLYCRTGTFALAGGKIAINVKKNMSYERVKSRFKNITNSVRCINCPVGGICASGETKRRGNFYEFKETNETIRYITCPSGYCCSMYQECVMNGPCAPLREGSLCGMCKAGFQENFFSNYKCLEISTCNTQLLFWLFFMLPLLIATAMYTYLE